MVVSQFDRQCQSVEFTAEVRELVVQIQGLLEQKWGDTFVVYNHFNSIIPFFEVYNSKERQSVFMIESNCRVTNSYRSLSCALSVLNKNPDLLFLSRLEEELKAFGIKEGLDEISCVLLYD
ncbi:MAG: hypothetical protein A2589_02380 [Candidatus Vogelbacteria bacterium RIFOXYD1_FULL_46_19]|uniref:Uncharacterized protein n=1 Tax=Candidatus Vogelbacteria bacterium RIFOXYD1_FULL_46_19 TaxID=1802439 RepID=A0A1G2QI86_9BACT|nr:MAG: hypothetical protein A2589_02380 [Candidatus Vogelbacteria bacterium RIFOXYD1_FULL_46_19]